MTNEDKKRAGERLRIQAETWNSVVDMLRDWKRTGEGTNADDFTSSVNPRLTILAGNISPDTQVQSYKIFKLTNTPLVITSTNKFQFSKRPVMNVDIPDGPSDAICVTQSPSVSQVEDPDIFSFVVAAVLGITLAYVRINNATDLFAVPIAGNVDFLDSATAGQVRIIEVLDEMQTESGVSGFTPVSGLDESGSGEFDSVKLCIVNLLGGGSSGGSITGGCGLAKLKPSDCIRITNSFDGSVTYGSNTGTGQWTSDTSLAYPGGSGSLVYEYVAATGVETLTLDGKLLKPCGNGCWQGGPQTEHASSSGGGQCDGQLFTICLECGCAELVPVGCCADPKPTLPSILYLTIDDGVTSETITLTYTDTTGFGLPYITGAMYWLSGCLPNTGLFAGCENQSIGFMISCGGGPGFILTAGAQTMMDGADCDDTNIACCSVFGANGIIGNCAEGIARPFIVVSDGQVSWPGCLEYPLTWTVSETPP